MRRRLAVLAGLAVLVALGGCTGVFGPGEPDQARLNENASYEWGADADVSLTVERSSYAGVYDVSNRSSLEAYSRDGLGRERHLPVSALRYRYANGTTLTANDSALSVEQTRQRTTIAFPNASAAELAFTAPRHGKQFATPVFVEGSYAVRLPPDARVGVPLLSQVSPGGYSTTVDGEYMTVQWDEVTSRQLQVRWYLERDLLLFAGLVAAAVAIGSGGALYYYRQIRRLARRREAAGIDVEEDDDPRDRGPPPGMR